MSRLRLLILEWNSQLKVEEERSANELIGIMCMNLYEDENGNCDEKSFWKFRS